VELRRGEARGIGFPHESPLPEAVAVWEASGVVCEEPIFGVVAGMSERAVAAEAGRRHARTVRGRSSRGVTRVRPADAEGRPLGPAAMRVLSALRGHARSRWRGLCRGGAIARSRGGLADRRGRVRGWLRVARRRAEPLRCSGCGGRTCSIPSSERSSPRDRRWGTLSRRSRSRPGVGAALRPRRCVSVGSWADSCGRCNSHLILVLPCPIPPAIHGRRATPSRRQPPSR